MVVLIGNVIVVGDLKFSKGNSAPVDCYHNRDLAEVLFNYCEGCTRMASIPQGAALAACKFHRTNKNDLIVYRTQNGDRKESKNFSNKQLMEYTPVKYNSKLMNSIWGLYNRYSPHNIKSNDDGMNSQVNNLQRPLAVAAHAITNNIVIAMNNGKN